MAAAAGVHPFDGRAPEHQPDGSQWKTPPRRPASLVATLVSTILETPGCLRNAAHPGSDGVT
jgi:hypothetical protein